MSKINWKVKLLIFSIVITLLGFVQWESWFNIEIRNNMLQNLADGELALGGIFLLVCTCFPMILNHTKGFAQGFLFLLFPFVLLLSGSIWMVSIFWPSAKWNDEYVYQNDNDYVIVQVQEAGFMDVDNGWRIVRTKSPSGIIRTIEGAQRITRDDKTFNNNKTEITFANKTWHKVSLPED